MLRIIPLRVSNACMTFEILSFIGPAFGGALFKLLSLRMEQAHNTRQHELLLLSKHQKAHDAAAKRMPVQTFFEAFWRVPVRPIITYTAFFGFFSLPFLPVLLEAPVHVQICAVPQGFWAWVWGNAETVCQYITLGPGFTWSAMHTHIVLMIGGFWFGERVVKRV